jgi:outer membrane protein assembly factor BamB
MKHIASVLLTILVSADLFAQTAARMEGMNPSRTNVSPAPGPVSGPMFAVIASNVLGTLKRIGADGSLILSDGAAVSSYEKTGRLRWRANIFDALNGAIVDLAIAPFGPIYASSANTLIALDPDTGKPVWAQPLVVNSGNDSGP